MALIPALLVAFVLGHPAPVQCDYSGPHGEQGYWDGTTIALNPILCAWASYPTANHLGVGVFAVLHEAAHASGIEDEHAADCWALARVVPAARKVLRVTQRRASVMLSAAVKWHDALPAPYSGACT